MELEQDTPKRSVGLGYLVMNLELTHQIHVTVKPSNL